MEPGERLEAVAYATWIEALRAEGRFREGNRLGNILLERTETDFGRTVAYFELACNLAEMEEDLDRALELAGRALERSPESLTRFPPGNFGLGAFQTPRIGSGCRLLDPLECSRLLRTVLDPFGHRPAGCR